VGQVPERIERRSEGEERYEVSWPPQFSEASLESQAARFKKIRSDWPAERQPNQGPPFNTVYPEQKATRSLQVTTLEPQLLSARAKDVILKWPN
jgi:hypothetical protein